MSRVWKSTRDVTCCLGFLFWVFMAVGLVAPQEGRSAPLEDIPVTVTQPDGEVLHLFASGDEYNNWLHDADHYTVLQDPDTGYYVYAVEGADGEVAPTIHRVGQVKPAALGLKRRVTRSPQKMQETIRDFDGSALKDSALLPQVNLKAPQKGIINNLVVFIRFSDSPNFVQDIDYYKKMFNSKANGDSSLYAYYWEASYNKLTIDSTFYPVPTGATILSYQDARARSYYQPYHAATNPEGYLNYDMRRMREHTLLVNAVNAVSSQVPTSLNIDGDSDGKVDNVCFIVQGDVTGWSNLLWPHRWSLYSYKVQINGKEVSTYNFQLETSMAKSGVGVLAHEMFHSLGAPDLYHYDYNKDVSPAWKWDVMNSNLNPPQHMTAYMKFYYGKWLDSLTPISHSAPFMEPMR